MSGVSGVKKEYRNDQIAVTWEPEYCIHTARCIQGNVAVFNPRARPWIHIDEASADDIGEIVTRCPTGALHYQRLDSGPQEVAPEQTTVRVAADGPLYLHGDFALLDPEGGLVRRDTRVALCRCGALRQ